LVFFQYDVNHDAGSDVAAIRSFHPYLTFPHEDMMPSNQSLLVVFKTGALHPVTTATIIALTCICFSGLRPEIQATRYAGGR
jgi:hypothetical protein